MAPTTLPADPQPWWADRLTLKRWRLILAAASLGAGVLWEIGTVVGSVPLAILGSVLFISSAVPYVVTIVYAYRARAGLPTISPSACFAAVGRLILEISRRPAPNPQPFAAKAAITGLWLFVALLVLGSAFFIWVVIHVGVG